MHLLQNLLLLILQYCEGLSPGVLIDDKSGIADFLRDKFQKLQKIEHFSITLTTFSENPFKEINNSAHSLNLMDIEIGQAEDNIGEQNFTGFLYFFD